jgi:signal transduction histidine kinase
MPDGGDDTTIDLRVLILALAGNDASAAHAALARHAFAPVVCGSVDLMCAEWARGAGVLLVSDDALSEGSIKALADRAADQPPWCDIHVLVVTGASNAEQTAERLKALPNVLLLARPVRARTLVRCVTSALRARARQYQVRDLITDLQETNRAKDDFIAMVSHELRAPLNVIRGLSQSLVRKRDDADALGAAAETISRNADLLAGVVEDLLDLARLQQRTFQLQTAPIDLAVVVAAAVETIRPAATAKRIAIANEAAQPGPIVSGDAARLEQVVVNLLSNAVKFTPRAGRVFVRLHTTPTEAVLTVADTGEGIPADFLPHVFEPFRQHEAGSARHSGLGLGLAIVLRFVQLHGGSVSAHSDGPGRGAEFTIRLPRTN